MTIQQVVNLILFSGTIPASIGLVYCICQTYLQKKSPKHKAEFLLMYSRMAVGKVKYAHKDSIQQQELAIEYTKGLFHDNGVDLPSAVSIIIAVDAAFFEASKLETKPASTTVKKAEKPPEKQSEA
jgi:hypothetical protein